MAKIFEGRGIACFSNVVFLIFFFLRIFPLRKDNVFFENRFVWSILGRGGKSTFTLLSKGSKVYMLPIISWDAGFNSL